MGKYYDLAGDEIRNRVASIIEQHHSDLKAASLKIDLLCAQSDEDGGFAVMLHGYPCNAIVRITSAKERAAGRGDAEIVIDKSLYDEMSEATRNALLDHELYHLTVAKDKHGCFKVDANHRPLLKMRLHDHEFGWFDAIAARHGGAATEVIQARQFVQARGQTYFGFDLAAKIPKTTEAKSKA